MVDCRHEEEMARKRIQTIRKRGEMKDSVNLELGELRISTGNQG
jgi:hypothetical protein